MRTSGRPPLTREQIVATALAIVDADGLAALTMRRLGAGLGVDPMAVYHHLPNKAALFDALVEAVWVEVGAGVDGEAASGWRERLAATMRELRQALRRHPHVLPVVGTRPVATPALFAVVQVGLAELAAVGFSYQHAIDLMTCLTTYTVGNCLAEVGQPVGGATADPAQTLAALDPVAFGTVLEAFAQYRYDADAQFELGLTAMLSGLPDPTPS